MLLLGLLNLAVWVLDTVFCNDGSAINLIAFFLCVCAHFGKEDNK